MDGADHLRVVSTHCEIRPFTGNIYHVLGIATAILRQPQTLKPNLYSIHFIHSLFTDSNGITLVEEIYPRGLTAMELLDQIKTRWKSDLQRESLSPQLTRLKLDDYIWNDKRVWKLVKLVKDGDASEEAEASALTEASETGG